MTIAKHIIGKQANVIHVNKASDSRKDCVKAHYQWRTLSRIIIAKLFRKIFVFNAIMDTI